MTAFGAVLGLSSQALFFEVIRQWSNSSRMFSCRRDRRTRSGALGTSQSFSRVWKNSRPRRQGIQRGERVSNLTWWGRGLFVRAGAINVWPAVTSPLTTMPGATQFTLISAPRSPGDPFSGRSQSVSKMAVIAVLFSQ